MTLNVVCTLIFQGDESALTPIKAATANGNVYSDRQVEGLSVLTDSEEIFQIFFTTRYEDPRPSTKLLAIEHPEPTDIML